MSSTSTDSFLPEIAIFHNLRINVPPTTISEPEIAADPDGEISLEWYLEPRKVFSVSIGRRNEITYAGLYGPNKTYGREYFGDEIPKAIFDNLDRIFS